MKRCPKCNFLYLDSDQICDLDQALLVADDSNIEVGVPVELNVTAKKASSGTAKRRSKVNRKSVTVVTIVGLVIGLILLLSYQKLSRPALQAHQPASVSPDAKKSLQTVIDASASVTANQDVSLPSSANSLQEETESSLAKPSPSPDGRPATSVRTQPTRLSLSSRPVSTAEAGKTSRGPLTIRLTDGSSLQADEVWRTKAGIWYRRKGMVTLLKSKRVRSVESLSPAR